MDPLLGRAQRGGRFKTGVINRARTDVSLGLAGAEKELNREMPFLLESTYSRHTLAGKAETLKNRQREGSCRRKRKRRRE